MNNIVKFGKTQRNLESGNDGEIAQREFFQIGEIHHEVALSADGMFLIICSKDEVIEEFFCGIDLRQMSRDDLMDTLDNYFISSELECIQIADGILEKAVADA